MAFFLFFVGCIAGSNVRANATVLEEWAPTSGTSLNVSTASGTSLLNDKISGDATTGPSISGSGSSVAISGIYDLGTSPPAVAKLEGVGLVTNGGGSVAFYYSDNGTAWTAATWSSYQGGLSGTDTLSGALTHRYWAFGLSGGGSPQGLTGSITDFRLYDSGGNELDLGPTVPSAPTNLSAVGSASSIGLNWTAPSGTGLTYNIYRGTTSGGESTSAIATGVTATSYTDSSVTSGQVYYYQVAAVNTVGVGPKSNEAHDSTHSPDFSITQSASSLTLYLGSTVSDTITISDLSGFNGAVAMSASALPIGVTAAFTPASATSTSTLVLSASPSATQGTSTITVSGMGSTGTHTLSISLTVSPQPTVVEEYSPAAISASSLSTAVATPYMNDKSVGDTTTFATSSGTSSAAITGIYDFGTSSPTAVAKVEIVSAIVNGGGGGSFYYSINGTTWNSAPMGSDFGGNLSYSGTLTSTIVARYWAYSCSGGGAPSGVSAQISDFRLYDSGGNELDLGPTVPSAPTNLSAVGSASSIGLNWTAPSGTGLTYNIYRGTTSGGESTSAIATGVTTTSYTDSSVTSGQVYYYQVAAVNTVGVGPKSNEAHDSTHSPDFSITQSASSLTLYLGSTVSDTITISDLSGFNGAVAMSASALPIGVTAAFTPASATSTSTLVLSASPSATQGTSTITVSGMGSTGTHTLSISLTVSPQPTVVEEYSPAAISASSLSTAVATPYMNDKSVGDTTTFATSSGTSSAAITGIYDFGTSSPTAVAKVEIVSAIVNGGGGGSFYYSINGTTWNSAPMGSDFGGNLSYSGTLTSTIVARYWAYSCSGGGAPSGVSAQISDFRLYDSGGNELDLGPTVPSAPTNLSAVGSASSIGLNWTAPSGTGLTYNIYRGTTSGGESTSAIATGVTTTSYTDSSVTSGQVYYYQVSAVNTVGVGPKSNEAHDSTHSPDFSITQSASSLNLIQGSTASDSITVIDLSGFTGNVAFTATGLPSGVTATFNPTSSTAGSTLIFNAASNAIVGTYSVTISGAGSTGTHNATLLLTVTSLGSTIAEWVSGQAATSLSLSNAQPTPLLNDKTLGDTTTGVTSQGANSNVALAGIYDLQISAPTPVSSLKAVDSVTNGGGGSAFYYSDNGVSWTSIYGVGAVGSLSYTNSPATSHRYWAVGFSGGGNPTGLSASITDFRIFDINGNEIDAIPVTSSAPTNLKAIGTPNTIALTWTSVGSSGVTYKLYRGTSPGGEGSIPLVTNVSSNSYTDSAVTGGVIYYYVVTAVLPGSESPRSNEASAVTAIPDFSLSMTPGTLSVNAGANATATININDVNGFNGPVALSYLYVGDEPDEAQVFATFSPSVTSTSSSMQITVPAGAYIEYAHTIIVAATSGSIVHYLSIPLNVGPVVSPLVLWAGGSVPAVYDGISTDFLNDNLVGDTSTFVPAFPVSGTTNVTAFYSLLSTSFPTVASFTATAQFVNASGYAYIPSNASYTLTTSNDDNNWTQEATGAWNSTQITASVNPVTSGLFWRLIITDPSDPACISLLLSDFRLFDVNSHPVGLNAGVPFAPTYFTVVGATGSNNLSWTAPSGSGLTYSIYRSSFSDLNDYILTFPLVSDLTATSYVDASAVPGVTYWYSVTASNAVGESARSNVVSATSSNGATFGITYGPIANPNPCMGITATAISVSAGMDPYTVNWSAAGPGPVDLYPGYENEPDAEFTVPGTYQLTAVAKDTTTGQTLSKTVSVLSMPTYPVVVLPRAISLSPNGTQQFTAQETNIYGQTFAAPNFNWTATGGSILPNGYYTAGSSTGSFTVTATDSVTGGIGFASVQIQNSISITSGPSVSANPVTGTSTNLNVIATDTYANPGLSYTWSATGPTPVTFSQNGSTTSNNVIATFSQPGTYTFNVSVHDNQGNTAYGTVTTSVVLAPATIVITPASLSININSSHPFSAVADDQFGNLLSGQSFTWYLNPGALASIATNGYFTSSSSAENDTVYASAGSLVGSASVTVNTTVPSAPTNLNISGNSTTNILNWTPPSGAGLTYNVYRGTSRGGESTTVITGLTSATFADANITSGPTYFYQVTAVNSVGEGPRSNEASRNLSTPMAVEEWAPYSPSATLLSSLQLTTHIDDGMSGDTMTAIGNAGTIPGLSGVYDLGTGALPAVASIEAVASLSSLNSSNQPVTGAASFGLFYSDDGNNWTQVETYNSVPTTYTAFTTVLPQQMTHRYWDLACTASTNTTGISTQDGISDFRLYDANGHEIDQSVPSAPTGLNANGGSSAIALSWIAPAGSGLSYNVYRGLQTGIYASNPIATGITATTYSDPAVSMGVTYHYAVSAVNSVGEGMLSNDAFASLILPVITINVQPTASPNPVASTTTILSVTASDTNMSAVLHYSWSKTSGSAGVTITNSLSTPSTTTVQFSQSGTYTFTVTVSDGVANPITSSPVTVVVKQTPTVIKPNPNTVTITVNGTQNFTATEFDQFTNLISTPAPAFIWTVVQGNAGGMIGQSSGAYIAPNIPGTYTVKATDSVVASVSGTAAVTVNPFNGFTLGDSPGSIIIPPNGFGTIPVTITPINGYSGTAALSLVETDNKNLLSSTAGPSVVSYSFLPPGAQVGGPTSQLKLTVGNNVQFGNFTFNVVGLDNSITPNLTSSVPIVLIVSNSAPAQDVAPPGWAADVEPTVSGGGGTAASTIAVRDPSGILTCDPTDLSVYNPTGPSVSYERTYDTARIAVSNNLNLGYYSPGLSPGWTDNYDESRIFWNANTDQLTRLYANGSKDSVTVTVSGSGASAVYTVPHVHEAPYQIANWSGSTSPANGFVVQNADHTSVTYTLDVYAPTAPAMISGPVSIYRPTKFTNISGASAYVNRNNGSADTISSISEDSPTGNPLMTFTYSGGYLEYITSFYGQEVSYAFNSFNSITQLSSVSTQFADPNGYASPISQPSSVPNAINYNYTQQAGVSVLSDVTAPDLSNLNNPPVGAHASFWPNSFAVSSITDSSTNALVSMSVNPAAGMTTVTTSSTLSTSIPQQALTHTDTWDSLANSYRNLGFDNANLTNNNLGLQYVGTQTLPTKTTDEMGYSSQFSYDTTGFRQLQTAINAFGIETKYSYFWPGSIYNEVKTVQTIPTTASVGIMAATPAPATSMDYYPNGQIKDIYEPLPNLIGQTIPSNAPPTSSYTYTSLGNIYTVNSLGPNGGHLIQTFGYTDNGPEYLGQPTSITTTDDSDGLIAKVSYFYYPTNSLNCGKVEYATDELGNVTRYLYNADNQVTFIVAPTVYSDATQASYTMYTYMYVGGPVSSVQVYNETAPELGSNTGLLARQTNYTYDAVGRIQVVSDPLGTESIYVYDAENRPIAVADGDAATVGSGSTHTSYFAYDAAGNLKTETYPDNATTTYNYNPDNTLANRIDANGTAFNSGTQTTYSYDPTHSIVQNVHYSVAAGISNPGPVSYTYDTLGRVLAVVDNTGTSTIGDSLNNGGYDDLGNVLKTTRSFNNPVSVGQLGPQNQTILYQYNPDNSVASMTLPGSSAISNPLPTAGSMTNGAFLFGYDSFGRIIGETLPWGLNSTTIPEQFTYTYTLNPNNASLTSDLLKVYTNGLFVTQYAYNSRNLVKNLNDVSQNPNAPNIDEGIWDDVASYAMSYDGAGNILTQRVIIPNTENPNINPMGNHPGLLSWSRIIAYQYDVRGRMMQEQSSPNGADLTNSPAVQYDNTYSYDSADNITSYSLYANPGYYFGNANTDNQISPASNYTYDGDGELTSVLGSWTGNNFAPANLFTGENLGYDAEQRPSSVSRGSFSLSNTFDAMGQRATKTVQNGTPTTTYFLYDINGNPVAEESYSSANGNNGTYVRINGFGADGWRERYEDSTGYTVGYAFDPLGSVVARQNSGLLLSGSNPLSQAVNDLCVWNAYGEELGDQASNGYGNTQYTVYDPVGYEGQFGYYSDQELAQRNYNLDPQQDVNTTLQPTLCADRYYDPSVGRFTSRDPIDYSGGSNLYAYCGGDPVNNDDPSGTSYLDYLKGIGDSLNPMNLVTGAEDLFNYLATPDANAAALGNAFLQSVDPIDPSLDDRQMGQRATNLISIIVSSAKGAGNLGGDIEAGGIREEEVDANDEEPADGITDTPANDIHYNNGWRDAKGQFVSPLGGARPGAAAVDAVEAAVKARKGWEVLGREIGVRGANGKIGRRYDLVVRDPNGFILGIEVKSGSASLTASQRAFDSAANAVGRKDFALKTSDGGSLPGKVIRRAVTIRVP